MKTNTSIILFICLIIGINCSAQDPKTHFILNEQISGYITKDYIARDYVHMDDGFISAPILSNHVLAKTDPLMVFPPDEGELTGGSSSNNENGVVGTLLGNLTVSPSGAAVYSIPIDVPPGVNGMTPSLGLVYNSQGGNGLLGMGWSLSGLSTITRTGTNLYNDGFIDGVDFDDNDQLMLDGQRLIPINEEKTEFRTEIETFSKIVGYDVAGSGHNYYKVWTKNGNVLEYGHSGNSKIHALNPNYLTQFPDVLFWHLNKITDRKGNYIELFYEEDDVIGKIVKISYGSNINTGQSHLYSIIFNYNDLRHDIINSFITARSVMSTNHLLDNIQIVNNTDEVLKTYQLNYSFDHFSHLESITVIDADMNIINPTKFEWGNSNTQRLELTPFGDNASWDQFFIDYTGDGKTDLIEAHWTLYNNSKRYDSWHYCKGNGIGFGAPTNFQNTPAAFFGHFLYGDFNGDGLQDMASVSYNHELHDVMFIDYIFLSNGNNFTQIPVSFNTIQSSAGPVLTTGDFDGNGVDEILLAHFADLSSSDPNLFIYQFDETNQSLEEIFSKQCGFQGTSNQEVLFAGNFIQNGKTDIIYTRYEEIILENNLTYQDPQSYILEFDIDNQDYREIETSDIISPKYRIFPGDFNGDGITDFLTKNHVNSSEGWKIKFIESISNINPPSIPNFDPLDDIEAYVNGVSIDDYNGDGLSDIIVFQKEQTTSTVADYVIYISNGNTFKELTTNEIDCIGGLDFHGNGYFIKHYNFKFHLDFNGDGRADFYKKNGVYDDHMYLLNIDYNYHQLLTITNGIGCTSTISYKPITDNLLYTKGTSSIYPIRDIQNSLYVVSSTSINNGLGENSVKNYYYEEAKVCVNGKGFLGFSKITNISYPNTPYETEFESFFKTNTDYYFNWLEKTKTYAKTPINTSVLLAEIINKDPVIKDFGNKRIFYYTPKSITKNRHTGDNNCSYIGTTLTIQDFNENDIIYGNVTSIEKYTDPDELTFETPLQNFDFYEKSSFTYDNNTTDWLIGLVKTRSTATWNSQDPGIDNHHFHYLYYNNSPFVQTTTHTPNGSTPLSTKKDFQYDEYGNTEQIREYAPYYTPHIPDRYTYFTYSPEYHHRFVTETKKVLDGMEYISSKTFFNNTGLPHTSTDLLGNTTTYYYDGYGRIIQTDFPDGTQTKHKLFWSQNHEDNPANGLYYIWSQTSGSPEVMVFKDKLGRELRSVSQDITNSKVYSDIEYNAFGQVKKESNSHYAAENILWTEYEYLATGKVKEIISPTSETTFDYLGRITNSTTQNIGSTNETIVTTQEVNAIGQTIKMTDAGGTIDYSYYGSGNIKNITTGGNITTMHYDEAGRQEQLVDPSAGTTSFVYNAFGELISQSDANNITYKTEYDGFGRISKKYLVGDENDIIDYEYYSAQGNGFGQLERVSMPSGIKTEFEYDNFGRTIKKTKTIDETDYEYTYEYNVFGKSKKQTWPSGFAVAYHYKNGYFSSVEQSSTGKILWELTDVNAQGQVKQYELGNGLLTTKEYDTYGFPVSIETSKSVQQNDYHFNTFTGNLEWRSTTLSPAYGGQYLREDFTYDDNVLKNRLETWTVQGASTYSNTYVDNGNIETKTGIGTYDYSTKPQPFSVDRITNPETTYLNRVKESEHHLNYTGFNKVNQIWATVNNDDPTTLIEFAYGPGRERCKTELYNEGTLVKSKLYIGGDYEIETDAQGNTRELHYIGGGNGLFAIYVINNTDEGILNYIHKDYLGSYEVVTNETGSVLERLSFDPWGRRRNPTTWTFEDVPDSYIFDRGYTGHEHIAEFDLINMNGRVYDPFIARFLSPDNFVQESGYSQNFNRYSYAYNNPLKFTDPDGEWIHLVIGAVIGGTINWMTHGAEFSWDGAKYFGIGAAAGALGAGVGAGVGSALAGNAAAGGGFVAGFTGNAAISSSGLLAGAVSGAAAGVTNGFVLGTGNAMMTGTSFEEAFIQNGIEQAVIQGVSGAMIGAALGALDAIYHDEDWLTGSPYKKTYITNGKKMIGLDTYNSKYTSDEVRREYLVELPKTDKPYVVTIDAPKGTKAEHMVAEKIFDGKQLQYVKLPPENNVTTFDFFSGTPSGGAVGIGVTRNIRVDGGFFGVKAFNANNRSLGPLFWYLTLIK